MKYFIGAKDSGGAQVFAEMVEVKDFDAAYELAKQRAREARPTGDFRITAVNEQLWETTP